MQRIFQNPQKYCKCVQNNKRVQLFCINQDCYQFLALSYMPRNLSMSNASFTPGVVHDWTVFSSLQQPYGTPTCCKDEKTYSPIRATVHAVVMQSLVNFPCQIYHVEFLETFCTQNRSPCDSLTETQPRTYHTQCE